MNSCGVSYRKGSRNWRVEKAVQGIQTDGSETASQSLLAPSMQVAMLSHACYRGSEIANRVNAGMPCI